MLIRQKSGTQKTKSGNRYNRNATREAQTSQQLPLNEFLLSEISMAAAKLDTRNRLHLLKLILATSQQN